MARFVEFRLGTWLEGLDDETRRDAESLSRLLADGVLDAVLALAMFEQSHQAQDNSLEAWQRDRELERRREEELAAEQPRDFGASDYGEWLMRLSQQARRDVIRQKWDSGELPGALQHRLPFLLAEMFVASLAQTGRTLKALSSLDLGTASPEVSQASDDFGQSLPAVKAVRDSVEHAETRLRGRNRRGEALVLAPVTNAFMDAPKGALIAGSLHGNQFGWTANDGSYREIEVSDATIEIARSIVQRALDALPWKAHGYPIFVPN